MTVVEAGHAHVMKFLPLSCELSIFALLVSFLGEKYGDGCFIFFLITD
jgi:hypothetical protein